MARMMATVLRNSTNGSLNSHVYGYNKASYRMAMTNVLGDYRKYQYDPVGQLTLATGKEANNAIRGNEFFSYWYDGAGNIYYRTKNAYGQVFDLNNLNQLTDYWSDDGTYSVAGYATPPATNVARAEGSHLEC